MSSYKVFGIYVNGDQSKPLACNNETLKESIDLFLNSKTIEKVVVIKRYV